MKRNNIFNARKMIFRLGATYEIEKSIKVEKEITIEGAPDGSTMLKSMEDLEPQCMVRTLK